MLRKLCCAIVRAQFGRVAAWPTASRVHDPRVLRAHRPPGPQPDPRRARAPSGPVRAADVARELGIPANQASFHLRQLAKYGLVEEAPEEARDKRDRVWRATAHGRPHRQPERAREGARRAGRPSRSSARPSRRGGHHVVDRAFDTDHAEGERRLLLLRPRPQAHRRRGRRAPQGDRRRWSSRGPSARAAATPSRRTYRDRSTWCSPTRQSRRVTGSLEPAVPVALPLACRRPSRGLPAPLRVSAVLTAEPDDPVRREVNMDRA